MNYEQHKADTLAWYVKLAQLPGWKEYVWAQVKATALEHPDTHGDLPARLTAAMQAQATARKTMDKGS